MADFWENFSNWNKNLSKQVTGKIDSVGKFAASKPAGTLDWEEFNEKTPFGKINYKPWKNPANNPSSSSTADKKSRPVGNADGDTTSPMRPSPNQADYRDGVRNSAPAQAATEKSQLEKFQEYLATIAPGDYDYKKSVTDAFAKAYASLDSAANTARSNKDTSSKNVRELAEGGSNIVKGESKNYQKITDDTARTNNSIYSGQVAGLQADRSKELAERAAFVEKLGIKEAGLGTAGSTQTSAINEAMGSQTRNADRINAYGQADQSMNNSRAQAILNEGTTRQAGLKSQLQRILGNLDGKRAEYGVQEAQAMQQAEQQAYANQLAKFQAGVGAYDKQVDQDFKTRDQMLQEAEFQAKYGANGQGGMQQSLTPTGSQAADSYIASQGEAPNIYRSFITNFMAELANDPNVRTNQVNPELIKGKLLQEADKAGLDPNKVNVMWEYQNDAPIKYMKQNQLAQ